MRRCVATSTARSARGVSGRSTATSGEGKPEDDSSKGDRKSDHVEDISAVMAPPSNKAAVAAARDSSSMTPSLVTAEQLEGLRMLLDRMVAATTSGRVKVPPSSSSLAAPMVSPDPWEETRPGKQRHFGQKGDGPEQMWRTSNWREWWSTG
ncbi:unnamed protein product [Prorocentrum cordatum]|uniref:Peptide deformylase n=1 Tax=Prorocentrum cordatum TaxID=2364126 RepID=A0ABN9Q286_9DINO|nr:unnamed protein product [Polarella glacialis]